MRRDFFLHNDSGGLSVMSVATAKRVVEEAAQHRGLAGAPHGALLLELYGDDAMPVRVVADEPLGEAEEAEWLGRVRHRIETPDGRILVCGGFDADVIRGWLEDEDPDSAGRDGVAMVQVEPGTWSADLYAHVGSTNGRELLGERAGALFRRDHPNKPFPLWIVRLLRFSGEEDPGHEEEWKRPDEKIRAGQIPVDLQTRGFVGFLLHLHRAGKAKRDEPQNGDWFELDTGRRKPKTCPAGLPSAVEDPGLVAIAREILQEKDEPAPVPLAKQPMDVFGTWRGEPLARMDETVDVSLRELVDVYLIPFLANDGSPGFEVRVRNVGSWSPPAATPDWVAVAQDGGFRAGPPPNWGGWPMLTAATRAGLGLATLPAGARLELVTGDVERQREKSGRLWLAGEVRDGTWHVAEASPLVPAETLRDALAYVREMRLRGRLAARDVDEHRRLKKTLKQLELFVDRQNPPSWEGTTLVIEREDIPGRCMLAGPLFRQRYKAAWPMARG
jgi:hypothetical protein